MVISIFILKKIIVISKSLKYYEIEQQRPFAFHSDSKSGIMSLENTRPTFGWSKYNEINNSECHQLWEKLILSLTQNADKNI